MPNTEKNSQYSCEGTLAMDGRHTVDPEENTSNMFVLNCTTEHHKRVPLYKSESLKEKSLITSKKV